MSSEDKEHYVVGHCGRIFGEFEICEEWQIDDLCQGCPMANAEEGEEASE